MKPNAGRRSSPGATTTETGSRNINWPSTFGAFPNFRDYALNPPIPPPETRRRRVFARSQRTGLTRGRGRDRSFAMLAAVVVAGMTPALQCGHGGLQLQDDGPQKGA